MGRGRQAIEEEWAEYGTDEDRECLHYVLHEAAGTSEALFPNGRRDAGRSPMAFDDFVQHERSRAAGLSAAHVLALRLYTTAAYKTINTSLRTYGEGKRFAASVGFLTDGIKKLRRPDQGREPASASKPDQVSSDSRSSGSGGSDGGGGGGGGSGGGGGPTTVRNDVVLWRGLRNTSIPEEFVRNGGTMHAPLSTTHDPEVALRYAIGKRVVLFRFVASSFMNVAPDLDFLSAFPAERECLYPPMTYLQPGKQRSMLLGGHEVDVLDVTPYMGT